MKYSKSGKYRLVSTIGNYWERRYEIQRKYSYYAKIGDTKPTWGWALQYHSSNKDMALENFNKHYADK